MISISDHKMSSSSNAAVAARADEAFSPLLALPQELRNRIYDFVFCVEHIHAIQHDARSSNKGNNMYVHINGAYSMTFEVRDRNTWRSGSQSLCTFLALTRVCGQIRAEIAPLAPFSENILHFGFQVLQHFLTVVPKGIRDDIKVISLWKSPGRKMWCGGDMYFGDDYDKNDRRVWTTLVTLLWGLPSLEKVVLNVRGGVDGLRFGANWQPMLHSFMEQTLERLLVRNVVVDMV